MRRRTRDTLVAALALAALAAAAFGPSLLEDRLFVPMHTGQLLPWSMERTEAEAIDQDRHAYTAASDKLISFRADDAITVQAFREGRLPLWNPSAAGGVPHLGQGLYGALYPPHLVFRFVDPERAYGWLAAIHHFLAALFTFLFVRRIGGGRDGALVAAIAFSFSTCLLARAHYYQYLYTFTWLPLGLLLVENWVRRGSRLALLGLAPVTALVLLVGWPQAAAFTLVAIGLWVLVHALARDLRPPPHRAVGVTLLAAAIAAGASWLVDPLIPLAFWPHLALLLVFLTGRGKAAFLRRVLAFAGVVAIGCAITSVQYLPAVEWAAFGTRGGAGPELLVANGMRRGFWFQLLLPGVFGDPGFPFTDDLFNLTRLFALSAADVPAASVRGNILENAVYFGLLPLLLLPFGALVRSPRRSPLLLLALLFGAFAAGWRPLVYPAYFAGFFLGSDPRRALVMAVFAAACLAGLGFRALRRRPEAARDAFRVAAALGAILATSSLLSDTFLKAPLVEHARALAEAFGDPDAAIPEPQTAAAVERIRGELLRSGIVLFAIGALGFLGVPSRRRRRRARRGSPSAWLPVALALVLVADLALAARPYLGSQPAGGFLASHPVIEHLRETVGREGRLARFDARAAPPPEGAGPSIARVALPPNLAAPFGLLDACCYTVSPPDRWMRLWEQGVFTRAAEDRGDAVGPEVPVRGQVAVPPMFRPEHLASPALDLMVVRAILGTGEPPDPLPEGIALDRRFGEVYVLRNERALPRAFTVARVEDCSGYSEQKTLEMRLLGGHFDPRERVLLEGERVPEDRDPAELPEARIVSETPEEIKVALEGKRGAGVLVLLDSYAPGWEAFVDGAPAEVLIADFAFRGVAFQEGAREVVFRYRPRLLRLAAFLVAAGLLLWLVLAARALLAGGSRGAA